MRKLLLAIATVTIVSMVSLGSHRAEELYRVHSVCKRLHRQGTRSSLWYVSCVVSAHAVCARCEDRLKHCVRNRVTTRCSGSGL